MGKFVAGHAGVIVPPAVPGGLNRLVEAMPSGARVRNMTTKDWTPAQSYFRLPEDYPGQALDAAAVALAMIGTPYSIASYIYLAAYLAGIKSERLAKRIDRRRPLGDFYFPSNRPVTMGLPVEAICSVLADQAWTITGKTVVTGTAPQVVTPGLLTEQVWNTPGVIRGGFGIL